MRVVLRKFLIMVAAYALALQPSFAAMSAAHLQAAAELCATGKSGDAPVPAGTHKDNECCLALGCNASAGADTASAESAAPVFAVVSTPIATARSAWLAGWPNERPHSARAPPV
jgi:hypothetical protein